MPQLSLSYANANSGANANNIGWIDFGPLSIAPQNHLSDFWVNLSDGSTMYFDIYNDSPVDGFGLQTATLPISPTDNFGAINYTGISGYVAFETATLSTTTNPVALFTLKNIRFTDSSGNLVQSHTLEAADVKITKNLGSSLTDYQQFITDGSEWSITENVGIGGTPTVTIINESTPISVSIATVVDSNVSSTQATILATASTTFIQTQFNSSSYDTQAAVYGVSQLNPALTRSRGINLFI